MNLLPNCLASTIVARSTPPGVGALAVIRISGPKTKDILSKIIQSKIKPTINPRKLIKAWIVDSDYNKIDDTLVVFFPNPNSFTGEDMAEIHCHGGEVVVSTIIDEVCKVGGIIAARGEFTRRAYENNKIDLNRAEAIIQMINAGSKAQMLAVARSLYGELSNEAQEIKELLKETLALVETTIDFPDEEDADIELPCLDALHQKVSGLKKNISRTIDQGMEVVVAGRPNVGKSSLVNALAKKKVSIVCGEPGTTRDAVGTSMLLNGYRIELIDTAGRDERQLQSEADHFADQVASDKIEKAGLVLWVTDNAHNEPELDKENDIPIIWIVNKSDLIPPDKKEEIQKEIEGKEGVLISALYGDGLEKLEEKIGQKLIDEYGPSDGIPATTRQKQAIDKLAENVDAAKILIDDRQPELAAEDLRKAIDDIGQLIGEKVDADVLDIIFENFCIGK
jgi:tRNA modification GTPase